MRLGALAGSMFEVDDGIMAGWLSETKKLRQPIEASATILI
jgi:hypothetical protein